MGSRFRTRLGFSAFFSFFCFVFRTRRFFSFLFFFAFFFRSKGASLRDQFRDLWCSNSAFFSVGRKECMIFFIIIWALFYYFIVI